MRAEVKEQAEESLSASGLAGGGGRKGGDSEETVIDAEGAGPPHTHTHHIRSRALGPHCPAQAATERLDSRSRGWDRHLNKSQKEHVLT